LKKELVKEAALQEVPTKLEIIKRVIKGILIEFEEF